MEQSVFGPWDYTIMALTMILSVAIGFYFRFSGGKQKTNEEYLLADRNMSLLPVSVSLMASFMSAITILGLTAETYYFGLMFVMINVANGLATPIATSLYLPVFFGLQKTSAYEYLELRFGPNLRILASLTYTLQMVLYNGIVLYAPAIVLEAVTGLDRLVSIIVVGLVCTLYSTLGGMKAVLFTDVLQCSLMFAAVLSVVVFTSMDVGGFTNIFSIAKEGGRLNFSNFSVDPTERHTWWSVIIGGMTTYLSMYGVNHTQVQRLLTVKTLKRSKACLWWAWPALTLQNLCTCISGLGIYAVYRNCDPLANGQIMAADQLMPFYVVDAMRVPGLAGLFVAGIFSASLSTISSACNSLAAVTVCDYVGRWCKIHPSYMSWLTKLAACAFGLIFLALAFVAEHLGGILQAAMTIFGAVGGPLLGVFSLGMFTTYANERGASIGLLTGLAATLWISFGGPRPSPVRLPVSVEGCINDVVQGNSTVVTQETSYFYLYRISYMWTSPIGFLWVMIIGSVVSLLWQQKQPWEKNGSNEPDPALFTPPLAKRLRARQTDKPSIQVSSPDTEKSLTVTNNQT